MDTIFTIYVEDKFKTVVEEIIKNLYDKQSPAIINQQVITTAKEEIKEFIIKSEFNIQKIHELLLSQSYDEERINFFLSIIQNRRDEILYLTLIHLNSAYGEAVINFDWVLKLVYGISDSKKLKYPLLQLALTTVDEGECKQKKYDINKDMTIKMISVLENINTD